MIIICSGPDTYRAREKARELVAAFIKKYDPTGMSVDVHHGLPDINYVFSKFSATSLFASKKIIRVDGLLSKIKTNDLKTLIDKLKNDNDLTILLTLETEPPSDKILSALKKCQVFHYNYPLLSGKQFRDYVEQLGKRLGVLAEQAKKISNFTEGNLWLAVNELLKVQANPDYTISSSQDNDEQRNIFQITDDYLSDKKGWRLALSELSDDSKLSVLSTQIKTYLKVSDGSLEGIHPFVISKYRYFKANDAEKKFNRLVNAFIASRIGLGNSSEVESLT